MKINNRKIWIILISAIIMISVLGYFGRAARTVTGNIIFKDIAFTKENYKYLGTETFSYEPTLLSADCSGNFTYCSYVYKAGIDSRADINKDGKIDAGDLYVVAKAFDCKSGQTCWSQPIEECFFTSSGRKFKDPTRDCKMDISDLNLIASVSATPTNPYRFSPSCNIYDVCKADINQDGIVDIYDISFAATNNGKSADLYERLAEKKSEADLNKDGIVDILDIALISTSFNNDAIERKCFQSQIVHKSGRTYAINIEGVGIAWVGASFACAV